MKRGTPDHPKTLALAGALGRPRFVVVGLLELLWHFTGRYAPRGDIGRWPDERIAEGLSWDGDAGELIRAFVKTGWLDVSTRHRLVVHDWPDHADEATKKYLARNGLTFVSLSRRRRDTVEHHSRDCVAPAVAVAVAPAVAVAGAVAVAPAVALPEPLPNGSPLAAAGDVGGGIQHDTADPLHVRIVGRAWDLAKREAAENDRDPTASDALAALHAASLTPDTGSYLTDLRGARRSWLEQTLRTFDRLERELYGGEEV